MTEENTEAPKMEQSSKRPIVYLYGAMADRRTRLRRRMSKAARPYKRL